MGIGILGGAIQNLLMINLSGVFDALVGETLILDCSSLLVYSLKGAVVGVACISSIDICRRPYNDSRI